jgi:probable HAF family extracellular repeat protein
MSVYRASLTPLTVLLLMLSIAVGATGVGAQEAAYKIREVEPLEGAGFTQPTAINASGVVVGNSFGNGPIRAMMWKKGASELLGPESGTSFATGLTKGGTIIGYVSGADFVDQAVTWKKGEQTELPSLGGSSHAWGVNDQAIIVGDSFTEPEESSSRTACVWDDGEVTNLGTLPGGGVSVALDVNADGQIVGGAATAPGSDLFVEGNGIRRAGPGVHAVLWQDGQMTDLGTLPGGDASLALAINDAGQIVGYSTIAPNDETIHAVLWDNGEIVDLGTLPGGTSSWATGINASGQIVGISDGDGSKEPTAVDTIAVLWNEGEIVPLSDLIPAEDGWGELDEALGINDKGQIAADGYGENFGYYGAVLTPE